MIIGGGFTGGSGSMHIGAELQKAGDRRGTLRRFNHFLSGYRVPITGIALLIVVEVVLTSYAPRMLQVAVDDIAAYLDGGRSLPEARRTVALADGGRARVVRRGLGSQRRGTLADGGRRAGDPGEHPA